MKTSERIATALEKIAAALESQTNEQKSKERRSRAQKILTECRKRDDRGHFVSIRKDGNNPQRSTKRPQVVENKIQIGPIIAAYVKAWQARYGTKARPDVGGRSQGVLRRLTKDHPVEHLVELVQIYCQMDAKWFVTKHHDLSTFEQNINAVSIARTEGHEVTNVNFTKVFGEENDQGNFLETGDASSIELGSDELPTGETQYLLEGASEYD